MKTLDFDIEKGFKKGTIEAYENDNNTEVYYINLYKDNFRQRYDLTSKTVNLVLLNKNKKGDIISLVIKNNQIQLPIKSNITLKDGVYYCQFSISSNNFNQISRPFSIIIKNNLFNEISGDILADDNYKILVNSLDRVDKVETELEKLNKSISTNVPKLEQALKDAQGYTDFIEELKEATNNINDAKGDSSSLKIELDRREKRSLDNSDFKFIEFEGEGTITSNSSLAGVTKDFEIKGTTLNNLYNASSVVETASQIYMYTTNRFGSEAYYAGDYTFKNDTGKKVTVRLYTKDTNEVSRNIIIQNTQTITLTDNEFVRNFICYYSDGWTFEEKQLALDNMVVVRGVFYNLPTYFTGLKSLGDNDKELNLISYNFKNLSLLQEEDVKNSDIYNEYYTRNIVLEKSLRSIPNSYDYILNDKIITNIKEFTIDGFETWSKNQGTVNPTGSVAFYTKLPADFLNSALVQDFINASMSTNYPQCYSVSVASRNLHIKMKKETIGGEEVSNFVDWLRKNNKKVYYNITKPEEKTINDINLSTYKDTTNIFIDIYKNFPINIKALIPIKVTKAISESTYDIKQIKKENETLSSKEVILNENQKFIAGTLVNLLEPILLNSEEFTDNDYIINKLKEIAGYGIDNELS